MAGAAPGSAVRSKPTSRAMTFAEAMTPAMMSDRFSGAHFGSIVGIGLMAGSTGSAFGPWLAGRLVDAAGNYTLAFIAAAGSGAVAGVCGWRARTLRRRAVA